MSETTVYYRMRDRAKGQVFSCTPGEWVALNKKHPTSYVRIKAPSVKSPSAPKPVAHNSNHLPNAAGAATKASKNDSTKKA